MTRVRFIHSLLLIFLFQKITAQSIQLRLLDSLAYDVNEVYIDRLNQVYLFPRNSTDLIKLNDNFSFNQKYSSPFISQYIYLDVKDPMKLLLFLPQFNNVNMYDESLAQISDEYFSDFNTESAICFYTSTQLCYFANNKINLKSIVDNSLQSGEQIFYPRKKLNQVSQIKSNGRDIYLLMPGIGLWHFNAFLNLESFVEDYEITRIDLMDDKLFYLKNNNLFLRNEKDLKDQMVYTSQEPIKRFALNKNYLLIAQDDLIFRFKIN